MDQLRDQLRIDEGLLSDDKGGKDKEKVRDPESLGRLPSGEVFLQNLFGTPEKILAVRPPPLPVPPPSFRGGWDDHEDLPSEGFAALMKGAGLVLALLVIRLWDWTEGFLLRLHLRAEAARRT